jgi:hypothetical protein
MAKVKERPAGDIYTYITLNECTHFSAVTYDTSVLKHSHMTAVSIHVITSLDTGFHRHTDIQLSDRSLHTSVDDLGRDFLHRRCASSDVNTGIR